MINAEYSDRRRRVIFMNSDLPDSPQPAPSRSQPTVSEPKRLRESDVPQSLLTRFRRDCGQTMPYLIRISSAKSSGRAKTILWDRPSLIIGRAQECDLRLPHAEVSRTHAFLQIVDGRIHCSDLGSASGTHWSQGQNSRQQGPLDSGEAVSIGPYSLTIEPAPQFGSYDCETDVEAPPRAQPHGLFLDFQDGDNEPRRWPATREVTLVGSSDIAKVSLVHPSVSRCHCAIVRAGGVLWIVDLLSEEGTTVNGELVSTACLESGDLTQIGRFNVTAHYGSPLEDEAIRFPTSDADLPVPTSAPQSTAPQSTAPPETDLTRLQERALAAAQKNGQAGGISEQFVLDIVNQMGVMQQQALHHAQQSMAQALQAVTATYQGRIEALEQEHAELKRQLRGLPGPSDIDGAAGPPGLPDYAGEFAPFMPLPPNMIEPEYEDLPEPEHGSFECEDLEVKEQLLREKMKQVEAELDKTRKGWGKRLIDLMGY